LLRAARQFSACILGGMEAADEDFPFLGYPKIGDSTANWARVPKSNKPWLVLEKVHG
jgi:hypothetical protein